MDLVQNLKKILKYMEEGFLEGLSSPSTKQKEKQILKKQDNSSLTMSSQKDLTMEPQDTIIQTSSADTSEKIIMENVIESLPHIREWSIDRINFLLNDNEDNQSNYFDATSIAEEFNEWINIIDDEIECLFINNSNWVENELE